MCIKWKLFLFFEFDEKSSLYELGLTGKQQKRLSHAKNWSNKK